MTEICEEIRAGVTAELVVWVERDYASPLELVADSLPQAWAPDGRAVTLSPLGGGCVVRAEVEAGDLGEAAAITDAWVTRLAALAEDLSRPGQLRLAAA